MKWALLLMVLAVACAETPAQQLDATTADAADAAEQVDVVKDAGAAQDVAAWWSDAPTCDPPQDASDYREPDRSRCPSLHFDPGPADSDAGMAACVPGRTEPCTCADGRPGLQRCDFAGRVWGCSCTIVQDSELWTERAPAPRPLPPRLLRPLSGLRVTSRRPTLRWVLPDGVRRARVEGCADRPCTRVIERGEVEGSAWRPTMRLPPGVAFWRVQGLSATGSVVWTSATWEFGVGRCDGERDTTLRTLRDFDGDGYDDAVFGNLLSTAGVVWGRPTDREPAWSAIENVSEDLLTSFATVGDINGDGLADLGVAHFGYTRSTSTTPSGRLGAPRHIVWGIYYGDRICGLRAEPVRADDFYRPAICDLNGDGFGDVASGSARGLGVFLGGASGLAAAPALELRFDDIRGFDLLQCDGDVDGDGYADLLVTSYHDFDGDGAASILYGAPDARIDHRIQYIASPMGGEFGHTGGLADLDGDGFSEVVIGSYAKVWIFPGSSGGVDLAARGERSPRSADEAGCGRVVPYLDVGELDGDGRADIVLQPCTHLSAYLSNGSSTTSASPRWRVGSVNGTDRIRSSSVPGDMNGDGWDDLLTSMWTHDGRGPYSLNLHFLRGAGFPAPAWSWDMKLPAELDLN